MYTPIGKIAIIGAGALGAIYGSKFYEMNPEFVCFIASGDRYDRLKRNGVFVNGKQYAIVVVDQEETAPADLLIVAVKHHHLDLAIGEMKKAVGSHTTIISVMNGIDSEERIGSVYGMDKVIYALTLGIDAVRVGNSVCYNNLGRILFGEKKNIKITDRIQLICDIFNSAGIAYENPPDMIRSLWFKYMINVGANQVSAVLAANYGTLLASSEAREYMDSAMREVITIAKAMRVELSEADIGEWYKVLQSLNPLGKTSMLQDVEAGRKTEVEMLAGTIIELGRQQRIPTPVNNRLFNELKRIEASLGVNS